MCLSEDEDNECVERSSMVTVTNIIISDYLC